MTSEAIAKRLIGYLESYYSSSENTDLDPTDKELNALRMFVFVCGQGKQLAEDYLKLLDKVKEMGRYCEGISQLKAIEIARKLKND